MKASSAKRESASRNNASKAAARRRDRRVNELSGLRSMAAEMVASGDAEKALDVLLGVIESLHQDNERLSYRLAASIRARFGRASERLTAEQLGQLVLALGGTQEEADAVEPNVPAPELPSEHIDNEPGEQKNKRRRPNHRGRTRLNPELERSITLVPVPEEERKCVHCQEDMHPIGHIDHEVVEFVPAQLVVHVERREKLACKACKQDITTAERRNPVSSERRVGASLLAYLLESKCDDALPIYRQREQLKRLGFDVPLNTLYGYWEHATTLLVPVAEIILSTVLGDAVVGVDDTKLDYLDRDDPRGKQRGHLWCFIGTGPLVAFAFTESWRAEDIEPWLSAIEGFVQCDDYKGYSSKIVDNHGGNRILVPPDRRLGCMMHIRRRFHKAFQGGHLGAAVPLQIIADIYRIEAEAKESLMPPDQRLVLRKAKSLSLMQQFDTWVDTNLPTLRPTSPLAVAAAYAKDQRPFINRCFSDGRFEIDNGRVEREIREPALGRKNFLFSGSAKAAERLAAAYCVVLSARRVGIPVRDYLSDILTKLASGWPVRRIAELLPDHWATHHGLGSANQTLQ